VFEDFLNLLFWFAVIVVGGGVGIGGLIWLTARLRTLDRRLKEQETRSLDLERQLNQFRTETTVNQVVQPIEEAPPILEPEPVEPWQLPEMPPDAHVELPPLLATETADPEPVPADPEPIPAETIETIEPAPSEPKPTAASAGSEGWEWKLGTVWLVRIGVIAFLIFLVLLGRYGYQEVSPEVRPYLNAGLLYLASFGMMGAGLFLHRRFEWLKDYSEVLTGGGMAAVYFSTFALYRVRNDEILGLIDSPVLAGVLLGAWAVFIIVFATRKESEIMAMFALAGAYFASYIPVIYDSTGVNIWFTFGSNVLLAVAAGWFVIRNRWANLSFFALLASYAGFAYWRFTHPAGAEAAFLQDALFLGVYWLIFTGAAFLSRAGQLSPVKRAVFVNLNNAAFFALMTVTLLLQNDLVRDRYWILPLAFAPVLLGLSQLAWRTLPGEKILGEILLAKAAVVFTVALMTLHPAEQCRTLLLAAETITIVFFGLRTNSRLLQYAAPITALAAAVFLGHTVMIHLLNEPGKFDQAHLNLGLFFGVLLLGAGWVARHWEGDREAGDPLRALPDILATLGLGGAMVTVLAVAAWNFPASTAFGLAAIGLVLLAVRPWLRLGSAPVFGEIGLFLGLMLWLPRALSTSPNALEAWNPALMLAVFAIAQQWHQRRAEGSFVAGICQAACVTAMGLIAAAWALRVLNFEPTHLTAAALVLGAAFSAAAFGLRSGQVFVLGQVFLVMAPLLCFVQMISEPRTITWQWAMAPVLLGLGNGLVLDRAREVLRDRLELQPVTLAGFGGTIQAAGLAMGVFAGVEFIPLEHQLWSLPVIGVALSTFCLGVRLVPGLVAAQGFMLVGAGLSLLSLVNMGMGETATIFPSLSPPPVNWQTLVPALGLMGMSHFALHLHDLYDEAERRMRVITHAGTSLYLVIGWALAMVWAFRFINPQYIFLLFAVVAIGHGALYGRRARIERALVAGVFLLVAFINFWLHAATQWKSPHTADLVPLLLLLVGQCLVRHYGDREKIPNAVHVAVMLAVNISLWQWVIRMWPGDASVIAWGVLAFVLIGLGLWSRERTHRLFGLIVLLVAMVNLTLLAARRLEGLAELLTYLGMSVILIVLGLLYIKFQAQLKKYL